MKKGLERECFLKRFGYIDEEEFKNLRFLTVEKSLYKLKLLGLSYVFEQMETEEFGLINIIKYKSPDNHIYDLYFNSDGSERLKLHRYLARVINNINKITRLENLIMSNLKSSKIMIKELEESPSKRPLEVRSLKYLKDMLHQHGIILSDLSEVMYSCDKLKKTIEEVINTRFDIR